MVSGNDFNNTVQLVIGIEESEGESLFDFTVRNHSVDELLLVNDSFTWIEKDLVLERYDIALIKLAVDNFLTSIESPDWMGIVTELRKHLRWEFD